MNYLNFLQKINNFLFSIFGLNDITLEFQVWINTKRCEKDVPDPSEIIYVDENDKEFAQ